MSVTIYHDDYFGGYDRHFSAMLLHLTCPKSVCRSRAVRRRPVAVPAG
jgi:hypothetical protein